MPMPVKEWFIVKDGNLVLSEPADGERAPDAVFAPWGAYEPRREDTEGDAEAVARYWLGKHPEVDASTVRVERMRVVFDGAADGAEAEPAETPEQPPEAEPPAPVDVPAVEFHVIDADTRKRVQKVEGGETVTGPSSWNLSASGDSLSAVEFSHNGEKRMEKVFPFMLFGDRDGVPYGEKVKPGPVEVSTRLVLTDGRTVDGPSVRFTFG